MAPERDHRIKRKIDGCSLVDRDGTVVFSVVPRTRPLSSLVLFVAIAFVVFVLTWGGTGIALFLILRDRGEMPIVCVLVGLPFAAYAGVKLGSLALTSRVFDIRCDGDRFELRHVSQNEFSLEDADGASLATLERCGSMWTAPRWKASDLHGAFIAEAVATNRIPDPTRRLMKGMLAIVFLVGVFLTLVVFLSLIFKTGPYVAAITSLALTYPFTWLAGFLSFLESTVEVHSDDCITARVTNQLGKSIFIVSETHHPSNRTLMWCLLAALVYA